MMPTDEDKGSAEIPFDGETQRLTIRRPRLDRDGLYLFGRRYAAQTLTLNSQETAALVQGKTIAADVRGEYILYIRVGPDGEATHPGVDESTQPKPQPRAQAVIRDPSGRSGIAYRERGADRRPSEQYEPSAARVRVNADRRSRRLTPPEMVDLRRTERTSKAERVWPTEPTAVENGDLHDTHIVVRLSEILGATLTAYIGTAPSTRTVRQWADGIIDPSANVAQRLRLAYHVASAIAQHNGGASAQAWFTKTNPSLNDRSPAQLIREEDIDLAEDRVADAATQFVEDLRERDRRMIKLGAVTGEELKSAKAAIAGGSLSRKINETRARTVADSLTTAQVGGLLRVRLSTVLLRREAGHLYAFQVGPEWRYPTWQFTDEARPLPELHRLVEAIPRDMHPASVAGFMTTPQPNLRIGCRAVTPREWMRDGGGVEPVIAALVEPLN